MSKARILFLTMIIGLVTFGASSASASGYPFAVLDSSSGTPIGIAGKFSTQFTQAEAQNLTASVVAVIQGSLGSTGSTLIYTPNQLAALGLGDGDAFKVFAKNNYMAYGMDLYIFLDITKVGQYVAGHGPNVRIDVYIADIASEFGINAEYLYTLSLELPAMYTTLLQSLQ